MAKHKNQSRAIPTPQRCCLFCDGLPLSREHLFADWIRKLVPGRPERAQTKSVSSATTHRAALAPTLWKPGNLASLRLRVVCKTCNETWMGRIEQAAIPVMTPLILGGNAKLSASEQGTIALWTTLKTIVGEQRDPQHVGIPVESIKEFFRVKAVLPGWQIWIGQYATGTWNTRYYHSAGAFHMPAVSLSGLRYNDTGMFQTSTWVIGKLLIHVASSSIPFPYRLNADFASQLHTVLPVSNTGMSWPPSLSFDDDRVTRLVTSLKAGRYKAS